MDLGLQGVGLRVSELWASSVCRKISRVYGSQAALEPSTRVPLPACMIADCSCGDEV